MSGTMSGTMSSTPPMNDYRHMCRRLPNQNCARANPPASTIFVSRFVVASGHPLWATTWLSIFGWLRWVLSPVQRRKIARFLWATSPSQGGNQTSVNAYKHM
jgi:hypothetical protein